MGTLRGLKQFETLLRYVPSSMAFAAVIMCGVRANAIGALGGSALTTPSEIFFYGDETLPADLIQNYEDVKLHSHPIDTQLYIPMTMAPSNNLGSVSNQVADKAFGTWLQDPDIQKSQVGRSAKTVEKAMKQEVNFQSASGVHHSLGVQVLAFQEKVQLAYKGWTNAGVSYLARDQAWLFEMREPIAKQKELVLSNSVNSSENKSAVTVSWNW